MSTFGAPPAEKAEFGGKPTDVGRVKDATRVSRGWDLQRMLVLASRVVIPVAVIFGWEYFSGDPAEPHVLIDSFFVSEPSAVWNALTRWIDQGILFESIRATVTAMLYGFALGSLFGVIVGFALGSSPLLSDIFRPYVAALNAIPRMALVPLFILWFGFGLGSKVAVVSVIVFFLVFFATYEGVRDVEQRLLDVLKVMDASRFDLHTKVRLPSAATWIIQGLRVSVPYSLVAAVTAEMIGASTGLGYLIQRSAGNFFTEGVFAGIFVLVLIAIALSAVVTLLERRLLRWKPHRLKNATAK
jgi:NitT/TauT family transport system permease protein